MALRALRSLDTFASGSRAGWQNVGACQCGCCGARVSGRSLAKWRACSRRCCWQQVEGRHAAWRRVVHGHLPGTQRKSAAFAHHPRWDAQGRAQLRLVFPWLLSHEVPGTGRGADLVRLSPLSTATFLSCPKPLPSFNRTFRFDSYLRLSKPTVLWVLIVQQGPGCEGATDFDYHTDWQPRDVDSKAARVVFSCSFKLDQGASDLEPYALEPP